MKTTSFMFMFGLLIRLNDLPVSYQRKISSSGGKVYLIEDTLVDWNQANENCRHAGGTLAVVRTNEEHSFIKSFLDGNSKHGLSYQIGGHKQSGQWQWVDGSLIGQTQWAPGEPNNLGEREGCLEYLLKEIGYMWNDFSCEDKNGYICQFDACDNMSPCTNNGRCVRRAGIEDCICSSGKQYKCNRDCGSIHLLFVLDTSLSLDNNSNTLINYTIKTLERLLIKDAGFRVAFMSYDYQPTEHLKLGQYQTIETIKDALQIISIERSDGPTLTKPALQKGIQILSGSDTYKILVLMSDGLSTDRNNVINEAEMFTISPYHVIICIGVGPIVDHLELVQLASRDYAGVDGPLVFPMSTWDATNMIAKLTIRKDCSDCRISDASDVIIIQDNTVSEDIFPYSINVAIEISKRYITSKKDVRLGRLFFDQNKFDYYSHDLGFLSLVQRIEPANDSSADMAVLLSQAKTHLLSSSAPHRSKAVVLLSEGHWRNASRVKQEVEELERHNVTVMMVAMSGSADLTQMYHVIQDPFYVFLLNDKTRWPVIDVIVSQSFRAICNH